MVSKVISEIVRGKRAMFLPGQSDKKSLEASVASRAQSLGEADDLQFQSDGKTGSTIRPSRRAYAASCTDQFEFVFRLDRAKESESYCCANPLTRLQFLQISPSIRGGDRDTRAAARRKHMRLPLSPICPVTGSNSAKLAATEGLSRSRACQAASGVPAAGPMP